MVILVVMHFPSISRIRTMPATFGILTRLFSHRYKKQQTEGPVDPYVLRVQTFFGMICRVVVEFVLLSN